MSLHYKRKHTMDLTATQKLEPVSDPTFFDKIEEAYKTHIEAQNDERGNTSYIKRDHRTSVGGIMKNKTFRAFA